VRSDWPPARGNSTPGGGGSAAGLAGAAGAATTGVAAAGGGVGAGGFGRRTRAHVRAGITTFWRTTAPPRATSISTTNS
jgi:hypothetical protein